MNVERTPPRQDAVQAVGEAKSSMCPRTAACRRLALAEFADVPGLAALFTERAACGERDPVKQARCARMLGLDDGQEEG